MMTATASLQPAILAGSGRCQWADEDAAAHRQLFFASETCAFDLLRAEYLRDVLPGELVMVTEDGVTSRQFPRASSNQLRV